MPACDSVTSTIGASSPCGAICFRHQLQQAGHRAASRPWPRARRGLREGEPRRRPAMVDWSSLVKRPPTPTSRQSTVRARVLHMTSRRARPASPSVPFASMPGQMQDGKERLPSANEEGPKGVEARAERKGADGICLFEMPTGGRYFKYRPPLFTKRRPIGHVRSRLAD